MSNMIANKRGDNGTVWDDVGDEWREPYTLNRGTGISVGLVSTCGGGKDWDPMYGTEDEEDAPNRIWMVWNCDTQQCILRREGMKGEEDVVVLSGRMGEYIRVAVVELCKTKREEYLFLWGIAKGAKAEDMT